MTVKDIGIDIVPCYIKFTCDRESAIRYIWNNHKLNETINTAGRTIVIHKEESLHTLLVFVDLNLDLYDIYNIKGLVVHELNHVVTEIFNTYGFKCDETRSYMLQYLYIKCMKLIDEELDDGSK